MGKQQDKRAERLAQALRENLRRRKAQARDGQGGEDAPDGDRDPLSDAGDSDGPDAI